MTMTIIAMKKMKSAMTPETTINARQGQRLKKSWKVNRSSGNDNLARLVVQIDGPTICGESWTRLKLEGKMQIIVSEYAGCTRLCLEIQETVTD